MSAAALRICVIGRKGQVASALTEEGLSRGLDIVHLARPEFDLAQEICPRAQLQSLAPDIVINAAAYTAVDAAEADEATARAINADAPRRIAKATAALNIPLIHLSTDYVFDGTNPAPYVEEDTPRPVSAYGRTKLEGERAVASANPRHVIVRTAWVYAHEGHNFVRTMLRLANNGQVRVVSDQQGCPTYATDLARAILSIATNICDLAPGDERFGVFHLAGSGSASWAELAEAVFLFSALHGLPTASVTPISSADFPTLAQRPANSQLDCARVRRVHGVVMPAWSDGLARCIARLAPQSSIVPKGSPP